MPGDEAAVEGDAGDDRAAAGPGADHSGQLLHERETTVHGQVEGRRADQVRSRFPSDTLTVGRVVTSCELPPPTPRLSLIGRYSQRRHRGQTGGGGLLLVQCRGSCP